MAQGSLAVRRPSCMALSAARGASRAVTMLRMISLLCAASFVAVALDPADAQSAPSDGVPAACTGERLSIYYKRGEAEATSQALDLIAHIGIEASRCKPDGIDLVTDIDTSAEGGDKQAITLALARLNSVAAALIANGVPADRIRMAATPDADIMHPPMGEVGVVFRKSAVAAGDASVPASRRAPPRLVPEKT